jgi:hypothetical protein
MQALRDYARHVWSWSSMPMTEDIWEDFEKSHPISSQIISEFGYRNSKKLDSYFKGFEDGYSDKVIQLYVNFFIKRVKELHEDPRYSRFFRRRIRSRWLITRRKTELSARETQ